MPRKLPPNVDRIGKYLYFRVGKGSRIRLPDDPTSQAFREAYADAMSGKPARVRTAIRVDDPGSIGALIVSYKKSAEWHALRDTTKAGYRTRLEVMREAHGHRAVAGLTRERIKTMILQPYADRPSAALDTLKKLRILIRHAIDIGWLKHDPSLGIKRPKGKEIRPWTTGELAAFEKRWPLGTKQRTAYALMRYTGAARVDVHLMTWKQVENGEANYTRSKTGVGVYLDIHSDLRAALAQTPRKHVTILNTEYGKPFTVNGFSSFMRAAMDAAGLPLDCKPHGLRKVLGRDLADADATSHDIRAALGHLTTTESDKYTREADRRKGGKRAIQALDGQKSNVVSQTAFRDLGKTSKNKGKSR
ncbi:MAG: tyrosine-type recombinase/integrase [Rhizobiales bacterium]|nr:tyrosine-type recombinase/integrase [Hyphomicrobiales bacterium]